MQNSTPAPPEACNEIGLRDICSDSLLQMTPLVSVHMLTYRHGRFLAQAIEGVLSQRCDFPFEIVIAEDCSPDDTLDIAMAYQEQHPGLIRIVTGERNVGMHRNSQRSTALCRGKYIAFCEGDDFWHHPDKCALQASTLEANPGISLAYSNHDKLNRLWTRRNLIRTKSAKDYESFLSEWDIHTATTMIRRNIYEDFIASKFHQKSWPFGDYNMVLYAATHGKLGFVNASTATYRMTKGSAVNSGHDSAMQMITATAQCARMFMDEFPVSDECSRQLTLKLNRKIMKFSFYSGSHNRYLQAYRAIATSSSITSKMWMYLGYLMVRLKFPATLLSSTKRWVENRILAM